MTDIRQPDWRPLIEVYHIIEDCLPSTFAPVLMVSKKNQVLGFEALFQISIGGYPGDVNCREFGLNNADSGKKTELCTSMELCIGMRSKCSHSRQLELKRGRFLSDIAWFGILFWYFKSCSPYRIDSSSNIKYQLTVSTREQGRNLLAELL